MPKRMFDIKNKIGEQRVLWYMRHRRKYYRTFTRTVAKSEHDCEHKACKIKIEKGDVCFMFGKSILFYHPACIVSTARSRRIK